MINCNFLFFSILLFIVDKLSQSQVLSQSQEVFHSAKGIRVLEHVKTGKCLTVSESFGIYLDDCNWKSKSYNSAGIFRFVKGHQPEGYLIRWRNQALLRKDFLEGCIYDLKNDLVLVECNLQDKRLYWELEPSAVPSKYLIKSSGKCLTVNDGDLEAEACDTNNKYQYFEICERKNGKKSCDN